MTKGELSTRIQRRLQDIPASHGGYIMVAPDTLRTVLSRELLERICDDAADEALLALGEIGMAERKAQAD